MNDETLKEQIDEILNDLANVASGFIIVPEPRNQKDKAKQAILDWHNKRELEAMIDTLEYAKISPKFKIEEKIEQLRLEMEKYEQTNDKNS